MPFERFMELALYDATGGFFGSGPLRSVKAGDFLTSPEVSPWFGRILARYIDSRTAAFAAPFSIVEAGAGSGSLLRPLLAALQRPAEKVVAVEASPAARVNLGELGVDVVADLAALAVPFTGFVIANELLDNLPMRLAARHGDQWEERWVGATAANGLELVSAPARSDTLEWLAAYAGPVADGGVVEVQLEAQRWLRQAISLVEVGSIVIIDYGATAEELAPRRAIGTLRTYRNHHLGPDPLLEPGATDITADVNFTALVDAALQAGAVATLHRQDDFLAAYGLRDVMADLRSRELELARGTDTMARLEVRSELKDAETLLHPRGLGDFRVLEVRVRSEE
jgi:SAM-dependent MidA family methyltransferase